ncbi:MAG: ArdC-like ssDNA-binding domain-containing protein [Bacteroidota bacterium]|nr:ArdC-like ssDNA-binding domain-containing protein [Bacteroidota bacterium]
MSTNFKPLTDQVAEKLNAQIKEGTSIFQRDDRPLIMPFNPGSGKNYREAAGLILLMRDMDDPRWMSLKNANFQNWPVAKDEKGTLISFYKTSEMKPVLDDKGEAVLNDKGKPKMQSVKLAEPVLTTAFLFNGTQLKNTPAYEPKDPALAIDRAKTILENAKPESQLKQQDFASEPAYYAALLKEMAENKAAEKASESRITDALKTNLAAIFISAELGLPYDIGDHVGYLDSWSQLIMEKPAELFKAANDAQKIADHVIRFEKKKEVEQTASTTLNKGDVIAYKGDTLKVLEILRGKVAQVENSDGAKFKVGPKDGLYAVLLDAKNNPQQQEAVVHEMKPQEEQQYAVTR